MPNIEGGLVGDAGDTSVVPALGSRRWNVVSDRSPDLRSAKVVGIVGWVAFATAVLGLWVASALRVVWLALGSAGLASVLLGLVLLARTLRRSHGES